MQKNRDVLRQVGGLAVALLVCIAVMLAVYALLGWTAWSCWGPFSAGS